MRNIKYLSILIMTTILVGCGVISKNKNYEKNSIQKKWELQTLAGKQPTTNQPIYIEFTADNLVTGFIACNRLRGNYSIEKNNMLKFSHLITTRMNCPQQEMALENQLLELLNNVYNYTIENNQLTIKGQDNETLAVFHEMSNNEIVNKYWKLVSIGGKPVTIHENQEKEQYFKLNSSGQFSGFAGCNQMNGQYELSVGNKIRFNENMAVTMKHCPDIDVNEREFLDIFKQTDSYTITRDTLQLNVGGRIPLAVFNAVYF